LMEQLDYNLLYRWFVGLSPSMNELRGIRGTACRNHAGQ
jgi:hypothetical protein